MPDNSKGKKEEKSQSSKDISIPKQTAGAVPGAARESKKENIAQINDNKITQSSASSSTADIVAGYTETAGASQTALVAQL